MLTTFQYKIINSKLFIIKKDKCANISILPIFARSGYFVNENRCNVQIFLFCSFLPIFAHVKYAWWHSDEGTSWTPNMDLLELTDHLWELTVLFV